MYNRIQDDIYTDICIQIKFSIVGTCRNLSDKSSKEMDQIILDIPI